MAGGVAAGGMLVGGRSGQSGAGPDRPRPRLADADGNAGQRHRAAGSVVRHDVIVPARRRATRRAARGRGRRRGGRPARHVLMGRRRIRQPVAPGLADRGRGRRAAARDGRTGRPVAAWRARSVPSGAGGPDGATLLGEGVGQPAFAAPSPRLVDSRGPRRLCRRGGRRELLLGGRGQRDGRESEALLRRSYVLATGCPAEKIDTCASSGSITPKTFCRVRRWTHEPQLSK